MKEEIYDINDLTTKEGLDKFNKALDELESNDNLGIFNLLGFDDSFIDNLRKLGNDIYEKYGEKKKEEEQPKFVRPSDKLSTDKKLQIHHIVEEYVNTMIRPYSKGIMTDTQINDAYAGLFEFACWIMNR